MPVSVTPCCVLGHPALRTIVRVAGFQVPVAVCENWFVSATSLPDVKDTVQHFVARAFWNQLS